MTAGVIRGTPDDPRRPVRVGMLGHGFMGRAHAHAFHSATHLRWPAAGRPVLQVLGGRRADATAEAATRLGFATWTDDWAALATADDVDLFDNVGPDALHVEATAAAIAAGKDVVCEKPLAPTARQAAALLDAAEGAGVRHVTCFNYRYLPAVRLARDMLAAGEIGEIRSVRVRYAQQWRTEPGSVGAISVIGCHAIDQVRHLAGEIAAVTAVARAPVSGTVASDLDDTTVATLELVSGAIGTFEANVIARGRRNRLEWELTGTAGALTWNLEELNVLRVFRSGRGPGGFTEVLAAERDTPLNAAWWPSGHVLGWEHAHANLLAEVVAASAEGRPLEPEAPTFADGERAAAVEDALRASAACGMRIEVPRRGDALT